MLKGIKLSVKKLHKLYSFHQFSPYGSFEYTVFEATQLNQK